ncbi:MAG: hypothetical protein ACI4II_00185 [Acutalibacteraceae bacterium]
MKHNFDSMTLVFENSKIEHNAVISIRLLNAIDRSVENIDNTISKP